MNNYQNTLNNMMCLDAFLMGLDPKKSQSIANNILSNPSERHILLSYDLASSGFFELREQISNEKVLGNFAKRFAWQINLKERLSNDVQALVLTDTHRQILWVNKSFEIMTGYRANEVICKKPNFLQGKNTTENTRSIFRQKLALQVPFEVVVINYRKNGEEYLCKVQIFPLTNQKNIVSHFLAHEQEM